MGKSGTASITSKGKGKKGQNNSITGVNGTDAGTTNSSKTVTTAFQSLKLETCDLGVTGSDTFAGMSVLSSGTGLGTVDEGVTPRLAALQQQLERLDQDRFHLMQRNLAAAGVVSEPEALVASLSSTANKTEVSLRALKKRLAEVRQQLYGPATGKGPPTPLTATTNHALAKLAHSYFGGIVRGGKRPASLSATFPDDDHAGNLPTYDDDGVFDEDDEFGEEDFEFEISGSEYFEDEFINEVTESAAADRLLDESRLGLRLFEGSVPVENAARTGPTLHLEEFDLVSRAEAELEAALDIMACGNMGTERKVELVREKFTEILRQDRHWRTRANKATRMVHELRMERQLMEMELDKATALKHRLESLCRDLHNENRRIKAEGAKREELAAAKQLQEDTTNKTVADELPPAQPEFPLPSFPEKAVLLREPASRLVDRIVGLADLFNAREQHFCTLLRKRDLSLVASQERISQLTAQIGKQDASLDTHTRRIVTLTRSEGELKAQVRQYVEKFRQVEETLGKSNDLFGTFRAEMEQMGAKLARLERENAQLNGKCATLSRNIIEMADERTKQNALLETLKTQKNKLEQLCRTLQAERNAALEKVSDGEQSPCEPPIKQ